MMLGTIIGIMSGLISILIFLFGTLSKMKNKIIKRRIKKYQDQISDNRFLNFQSNVLKMYYDGYFTNVQGKDFPVYTFEGVPYSFYELDNKILEKLDEKYNGNMDYKRYKYYKKYKSIISQKVHYPERPGFMMKEILLNDEGKTTGFIAWVGTYEDMIYTSYILEYELFLAYKKFKYFSLDKYEKIKNCLTIRNFVHSNKPIKNALETGLNRASLFGVILLILYKDDNSKYKVLLSKSSRNVSSQPDCYKLIPAGAFEAHDNTRVLEKKNIEQDFSVIDAVFREYLEELFNKPLDGKKTIAGGSNRIRAYDEIRYIIDMIDKKTAFLEYLGIAVSLNNLSPDHIFLLKIDDEKYAKTAEFELDNESINIFGCGIDEIEDLIQGNNMHLATIGAWHLLKKNHLYKEIVSRERKAFVQGSY